jgi:enoyl-CoA hydratase/carnithine racemase
LAKVTREMHGRLLVLRLENGVTNAIGLKMLQELERALAEVQEGCRGLVLAGNAKFFSIGLDLPELLSFDRRAMENFWNRFEDLVLGFYTLEIPSAVAIAGHATGGGAILALTGDYRFMAAGRKLIALNEVRIGVPVPYLADLMLRQIVADRVAVKLELQSGFLGPEEAAAAGLVDGVCTEEDAVARALERVEKSAAMPPEAFALTKQHRTREIPARFNAVRESLARAFLDCWFTPAALALLKEAAAKF